MRAVLNQDIERSGDAMRVKLPKGTIGTLEKTEVVYWDYEFYPNGGNYGICVHENEITIIIEKED